MKVIPSLVGVRQRVFGCAVQGEVDRRRRLAFASQPHQRHRAEIRGFDVFRIEGEGFFGRGQRRGPVAAGKLDRGEQRERVFVLGIQPE